MQQLYFVSLKKLLCKRNKKYHQQHRQCFKDTLQQSEASDTLQIPSRIRTAACYVKLKEVCTQNINGAHGKIQLQIDTQLFDLSPFALSLFRHSKAFPDLFDYTNLQQGMRSERKAQSRVSPLSHSCIRHPENGMHSHFSLYCHVLLSSCSMSLENKIIIYLFLKEGKGQKQKKMFLKICPVISLDMNRSYSHFKNYRLTPPYICSMFQRNSAVQSFVMTDLFSD